MARLSDSVAAKIVEAAILTAREKGFQPLAIAVLDDGGHLVMFRRENGAGFARFHIAYGKAWGALGMGFGTRVLAERASRYPTFVAALASVSDGRMVPSPGGVLVLQNGETIGAVGISGDMGENDEVCAVAGIEAAGLVPAVGHPHE